MDGPDAAYFSTVNGAYQASFNTPGVYWLRLTATDGELSRSDDVQVTVYDVPNAPGGDDQPHLLRGVIDSCEMPAEANPFVLGIGPRALRQQIIEMPVRGVGDGSRENGWRRDLDHAEHR